MSKWRIELDGAFNTEEDAVSFLNLIQAIKGKFYKGTEKVLPVYSGDVKTGLKLETPGVAGDGIPTVLHCRYHECFHDENPPKPCGEYHNFDLKDEVVIEVKTRDGVLVTADNLTGGVK